MNTETESISPQISDAAVWYRLMSWMTPSFPVGAFAYSHGIEQAVADGYIDNATSLKEWLGCLLYSGGIWSDLVILSHIWRALQNDQQNTVMEIMDLARALSPTEERRLETLMQGRAFASTIARVWPNPTLDRVLQLANDDIPYPVAVAAACAGHRLGLSLSLVAYAHSTISNFVSAGVRLVPLGQTDGQKIIAGLEDDIHQVTAQARTACLNEIGGCAWISDILSMKHETLYTRLFRS